MMGKDSSVRSRGFDITGVGVARIEKLSANRDFRRFVVSSTECVSAKIRSTWMCHFDSFVLFMRAFGAFCLCPPTSWGPKVYFVDPGAAEFSCSKVSRCNSIASCIPVTGLQSNGSHISMKVSLVAGVTSSHLYPVKIQQSIRLDAEFRRLGAALDWAAIHAQTS